jgi:acyl-CoA synthetase (AMP-forming)/AMP-acid ligase II
VPALIQFTSGSTGDPKGVVVSQRALLANARAIAEAAAFGPEDATLTWLPLFHDMGLVGHLVTPLVAGVPATLMPPEVFVRRPVEWLSAVGRYRATVSTAPNFAYRICAKRIPERDLDGLDLSSLRLAMCGGEPVHAATLAAFAERFAGVGLRASALFPVYGLAEHTLAAAFPPPGRGPRVDVVRREPFAAGGVAEPAEGTSAADATLSFVSVGQAMPGHAVRIVDAAGTPLPERREGEIEVSGPSRMDGYHGDAAATARALRDGWLRTGDRGYLAGGELHVSGRSKEMAVIRGRNVYPQDVERAAESVDGVRAGRSAAFGVPAEDQGTEALIVICELSSGARRDADEELRLTTAIRRAVLAATGVTPDGVALAEPGTVPKTSSGKTQRALARARYLELTAARA